VQTYNTSGGFLHAPIEEVKERASQSLADGIGGIKIKVGQPDSSIDLARVTAVREHLGDSVPLMVDANQQWDRPTALRFGRVLEQFDLVWIEEPLDAYDAEGHGQLAAALDTPIATGEMLSSVAEHIALIEHRSVDIIQPDAPRIGGITPFLRLAALADQFLDRDARSDFAGPSGMQGFLLSFLNDPNQDLDKFLSGIQAYYDSLPPEK